MRHGARQLLKLAPAQTSIVRFAGCTRDRNTVAVFNTVLDGDVGVKVLVASLRRCCFDGGGKQPVGNDSVSCAVCCKLVTKIEDRSVVTIEVFERVH